MRRYITIKRYTNENGTECIKQIDTIRLGQLLLGVTGLVACIVCIVKAITMGSEQELQQFGYIVGAVSTGLMGIGLLVCFGGKDE